MIKRHIWWNIWWGPNTLSTTQSFTMMCVMAIYLERNPCYAIYSIVPSTAQETISSQNKDTNLSNDDFILFGQFVNFLFLCLNILLSLRNTFGVHSILNSAVLSVLLICRDILSIEILVKHFTTWLYFCHIQYLWSK